MGWVYAVEVDQACRGRGYGRESMRLAETEARARGMRSLGLNVHGSNTVARSMYASLGYEIMQPPSSISAALLEGRARLKTSVPAALGWRTSAGPG